MTGEQADATMVALQWVNPIIATAGLIAAIVGFVFTAAALFAITMGGVIWYLILRRRGGLVDAQRPPVG